MKWPKPIPDQIIPDQITKFSRFLGSQASCAEVMDFTSFSPNGYIYIYMRRTLGSIKYSPLLVLVQTLYMACKKSSQQTDLQSSFAEVQKHHRVQGAGTQLTNLKLSMFTSEKAPHQNHASLDVRGGECKWLASALLEVIKTMLSDDLDHHVHMKQCLEALVQLVCLWDSAPAFLSDGQCEMVITLMNAFLQHYTFLNDWASKENRKLFHKVNKHHSFIHLCLGAGELNPRLHWCFKSEDFVGHISRLGHSVSPGVASTSTKLLTQCRVLRGAKPPEPPGPPPSCTSSSGSAGPHPPGVAFSAPFATTPLQSHPIPPSPVKVRNHFNQQFNLSLSQEVTRRQCQAHQGLFCLRLTEWSKWSRCQHIS